MVTAAYRYAAPDALLRPINGGSAIFVAPSAVPGAPTSLLGTPTSTTIVVTWAAPVTGDTPEGYTVSLNGATPLVQGNTLTRTLTDLTPDTTYTITVRAFTDSSTGPPATITVATTATPPPTTPGLVTSLAGSPTTTTIALNWGAPTTGAAPTSYTVAVGSGAQVNVGNVLNYTVTGLTPSTTYALSVRAVAGSMVGPPSTINRTTGAVAPPSDTSWDDMLSEVMDSRSLAAADGWYDLHTGIGSIDPVTMPAGYVDPGPLTRAQLVQGSLTSTHDGQVFIGIEGTNIRVNHNNVTYVRCWVTGLAGRYAGAYTDGSREDGLGGARLEACTFAYARNYSDYPSEDQMILRDPFWWNGRALPGGATYSTIVRRCRCYNWTGGMKGHRVLLEYNRYYQPQFGQSAHINAWRLHTSGRAWRNYGNGGNSGTASMYFDEQPMDNVSYEENFLDGTYRGTTVLPQVHCNMKSGIYLAPATGIVIRNNYHGPLHQSPALYALANPGWGEDGNIFGPNYDIPDARWFSDNGTAP